jgi:hypothetical protein
MTKRASWKSTGALPKPAAAFADKRATLEMLQVHVLKNKQAEHLVEGTVKNIRRSSNHSKRSRPGRESDTLMNLI